MPVIEFKDGSKIGQSQAVMRYLGKCYGYYPKDSLMAAKVDFMVENFIGISAKMKEPKGTPEEFAAMEEELFGKIVPELLQMVTPFCLDKGFLMGDKLTIADFWVGAFYTNKMNNPLSYCPEKWAKAKLDYPAFTAYGERFTKENAPYLSKRPQLKD